MTHDETSYVYIYIYVFDLPYFKERARLEALELRGTRVE